jgi:hypothetical protein
MRAYFFLTEINKRTKENKRCDAIVLLQTIEYNLLLQDIFLL